MTTMETQPGNMRHRKATPAPPGFTPERENWKSIFWCRPDPGCLYVSRLFLQTFRWLTQVVFAPQVVTTDSG
jgi:hypothetical protein